MAYMQRPLTYPLALRATMTTSSGQLSRRDLRRSRTNGKIATTRVLIRMGLRPEPKDRTYPSSLDRSVRYSSFETFSTRSLPHHRCKPLASIAISQLSRPPGGRAEKRRLVCDREQERKPGIGSLMRDRGSFPPQRSSRVSTVKGGRTRRRLPRLGCVPRGYLSGRVHAGPWCFARPLAQWR